MVEPGVAYQVPGLPVPRDSHARHRQSYQPTSLVNGDPLRQKRVRRRDEQTLARADPHAANGQYIRVAVADVAWHKEGDRAPQCKGQPKDARTSVARGKPAARELHHSVPPEKRGQNHAFESRVQPLRIGELRKSDRESHALEVAGERAQENASGDGMNIPESSYPSTVATAAADAAAVYVFHGSAPTVKWTRLRNSLLLAVKCQPFA